MKFSIPTMLSPYAGNLMPIQRGVSNRVVNDSETLSDVLNCISGVESQEETCPPDFDQGKRLCPASVSGIWNVP
jgi:hypothetical protein